MEAHGRRLLLLLLCCRAADCTRGSAHTGLGQLYPPTNITFGMNGMFCLFWKWTPTDNTENCSLLYKTNILSSVYPPPGGKDKYPNYTKFLDARIDLNKNLILKVYTECDNKTSDLKYFTSMLATGNPRTLVKNLTCVWHYREYVICTWQPGEDAPPSVNYTLRYWLTEEYTCPPAENKQPTPFIDLLDEGEPCQNYTHHSGIPVGCQFKLEKAFNDFIRLVAVVSDRSQNIKPYIYFIEVNAIAKLKAPVINEIKITQNNSVFVSWNVSNTLKAVVYGVQLEMSNSEKKEAYLVFTGQSKEFPNALPDVTYKVKVRAKLAIGLPDSHDQSLWSEWSDEKILQVMEGERTTSIVLLLLVPLIIITAAVFLLIYMKRLQILIFPQIPDPGRVISSDFQQWIKYGKSVYNEPKKDEVCVVSLLETPPSSSQVE
ncbi:interleukin-13 receptor subunit alpha-1-like [Rhinoderma darwinii]|uniref:interleukin-13 receptor subunit alpha-1-like n=1 Tax=Rhinoderma darwinii TaxID=43563 RepID=UPI003F66379B